MKKIILMVLVLCFMAVQVQAAVTVIIKNNGTEVANFDLNAAEGNQIRRHIKNQYGTVNSSSIEDFMKAQFRGIAANSKGMNKEQWDKDNATANDAAANAYP